MSKPGTSAEKNYSKILAALEVFTVFPKLNL